MTKMTTYSKIKNTAKNYLGSALVAGSLILSGYGCSNANFPVNPETKQDIVNSYNQEAKLNENRIQQTFNELRETYHKNLDSANIDFNKSIEDKLFTQAEQKKVYFDLVNAEQLFREIQKYAIDNKIEFKEKFPDNFSNLESDLGNNINGSDWGIPNLELKLKEQQLQVKVEEVEMSQKVAYAIVGGIVGSLGLIFLSALATFGYYGIKENKKRSNRW